jgi:ferritin-like metal-binding protein YciE
MLRITTPWDLFLHELHLIYDTEHKIGELLRETSGKILDKDLSHVLREHGTETAQQITKLDECFQKLGERPQRMPCAAIDGIRQDYQTIANQNPSPDVLDMAMLSTAIKIKHFEIGTYRGLVDRAMLMHELEVAEILQSILYGEDETAAKLERISHEICQRSLATL